ncbi:MAG: hypothetical protein C0608_08610 [Deltaproteobacteria bacterium]|nr:MAG: hypothetical protein C0608_08610 [Deltaproteobacteria bacterium]
MGFLKKIETAVIPSPLGNIFIEAREGKLSRLRIDVEMEPIAPPKGVLEKAAGELNLYFARRLSRFSVPTTIPEAASEFQIKVWEAMRAIPYGETRTYGELAKMLETSPRAVGGACRRNPIPILTPCHRVVGKNGLGGFSGQWETGVALYQKEELLKLEAATGFVA